MQGGLSYSQIKTARLICSGSSGESEFCIPRWAWSFAAPDVDRPFAAPLKLFSMKAYGVHLRHGWRKDMALGEFRTLGIMHPMTPIMRHDT